MTGLMTAIASSFEKRRIKDCHPDSLATILALPDGRPPD